VRGSTLEDLDAFLHRPGELAQELLAEGYTAMKVWPFDRAAESSRGNFIEHRDLAQGLSIVEDIRASVGDAMDVLIEMHGLWKAPAAATILRALNDVGPYWVEDPVRPDAYDSLERLREVSVAWIASGETLTGRRAFEPLLARGLVDVATLDVMWCGGLTEARKIASMADAHDIPIAPHDCTGPVALASCAHLVMSQPNGLIQETARAFLRTWYTDLVTGVPEVVDGQVLLNESPGHGIELLPGLRDRPGVVVRSSTASGPVQ
jgi:L-alanine-DL-glutamate epimerase-like enolase superfamily enzyme